MHDLEPLPPRFHRIAAAVGLAVAIASTWPVAVHLRDHVIDGAAYVRPDTPADWWARNIGADVLQTVWIVAWDLHGLATHPLHLFDANIYHPAPLALARAEHLFATALLGAPGYVLDGPVLAHQTALLLCVTLNVWAMALLVARWSGSLAGALVGGLLLALSYFHSHELPHLQSLGTAYLPLMLFTLDRLGATAEGRWAIVTSLALALQILSGQYLAFFAMLVCATGVLVAVPVEAPLAAVPVRLARNLGWLALGAIAAAVITLPFAAPYLRLAATGELPDNRQSFFVVFGLPPASWLTTAPNGRVFSPAAALLAAIGAAALARGTSRERLRLASLVAAGTLGVSLAGGVRADFLHLYPVLDRLVPGIGLMRVASRWVLVPCFSVAVLGGLGAAALVGRFGRLGVAVASVLAAVAVASSWHVPVALRRMPVGDALPPAYRFLARCGAGDPLLELPAPAAFEQWRDAEPVFFSAFHWLPLLNGRASYPPPGYVHATDLARQLPFVPKALQELRELTAVRWILVHCDAVPRPRLCDWPQRGATARMLGTMRLLDLGPMPSNAPPRPTVPADCAEPPSS